MNQAFICYARQRGDKRTSKVVEDVQQKRAQDAQLRLARIQNTHKSKGKCTCPACTE